MSKIIDLRSDTVTKPTLRMRSAMMNAEVGDDCYGEDPTVNKLEQLAAEKVGKQSAVFVPSGTMGNTSAIISHTHPGETIVVDSECHIYYYERGNMASIAGVMPIPIDTQDGCFDAYELEPYLQRDWRRFAKTSLICLENTHNRRGGIAIPIERMKSVYEMAKKYDVQVHLDGARIFNAALALGVSASEIASYADSVMFCLSKGLCAPVGSLLAGDEEFIEKARVARKRLGGAMRQAGILAAAGIVALTEMVDRLAEDHENAKILANELSKVPEFGIVPTAIQTNMVIFSTNRLGITAPQFAQLAEQRNIKVSIYGPTVVRLVTNKDVTRDDVLNASKILIDLARRI